MRRVFGHGNKIPGRLCGYNRVVKVGSEVHLEAVVEDVKGYRTKDYELKKKFLAGKGIEVTEI